MTIIATAPVPSNGHRLSDLDTAELPEYHPAPAAEAPPAGLDPDLKTLAERLVEVLMYGTRAGIAQGIGAAVEVLDNGGGTDGLKRLASHVTDRVEQLAGNRSGEPANLIDLAEEMTRQVAAGKISREDIDHALSRTLDEEPTSGEAADAAESPLPCPSFCQRHTDYSYGGDRNVWAHTTEPVEVVATHAEPDGPPTSGTVKVHAERFDSDTKSGWPVVLLEVNHSDPVGATAGQAERIGRALLDSAAKVRVETARLAGSEKPAETNYGEWTRGYLSGFYDREKGNEPLVEDSAAAGRARADGRSGSPVWPPKTCPAWCPHSDDPAGHLSDVGHEHYEDRSHVHDHYQCTGESASDCEAGEVPLTLERLWSYETGQPGRLAKRFTYQTLVAQLSQHYREAEPRIGLAHFTGLRERGSRCDMTLDEADQLARLLGHLVELGRAG